jgi:hypothetical protein
MKRACLFTIIFGSIAAGAQTTLPWNPAEATHRVVCRIDAARTLRDPVITVPANVGSASAKAAFVDADAPETPLPFYASTNGCMLVLPGMVGPGKPRHLIACKGALRSQRLEAPPSPTGDYARTDLGRAWDFNDGTQCGITSWGNGSLHIGHVTVKDGWLQIPVKDTDPYFIFGPMFGPSGTPRDLHIDSSLYRTLELRVRQSCPRAEWEFFVTDRDGQYKSTKFEVRGDAAQTFRFDLRTAFPDFWDGREFRALRIDTTNDKKDVLAEVDFVRLLPEPPTVTVGPVFSREAVTARATVTRLTASLPRSLTAGSLGEAKVKANGQPDTSQLVWSLVTPEHGTTLIEGKTTILTLPALTRAGDCAWRLGLADDLGQPIQPASGTLRVEPAALASYRLAPAKEYIDLAAPSAVLIVQGLDAFGNPLPVNIKNPHWTLSGSAQAPAGRIKGDPASVTVICPNDAPATLRMALADDKGISGETAVTTVAYRKDAVRLNANGCLVTPAGSFVFPAGGLYANWPHRPSADGTVGRSVDLFPCGPSPYKEGFPWKPETEAAVGAYLKHCSERGVTCLRLMLRNMDLVGRVDPVQLKATLHLFDLARPYGIRFNVALMEDYDKPPYVSQAILEKIVLPNYTPGLLAGLPPHRTRFLVKKETLASAALRYSDRDAIACQKDYLRELIPVLAAREEVLCYEFENEMVYPPMAWCREIAAFIRTIDPHTLILGNPGPHDWPEPLRWRESGCDLFSFHPYNDGHPAADHGAIVYLRSKFAAQSGLPMYTGEGGLNQNRWSKDVKQVAPESAALGTRDQIWMSVCCGANGCLYWTIMHDLEAQEFAKIKPAFDALGLDFTALKRQRPQAALLLPPKQRDVRDAAMAMRLLDLGVDFDTVTTNEASAFAVRIDLDKQSPQSLLLPATVAAPSAGYQIATLLSQKSSQALLYLRNVAGGVKDFGAPPRPCFLRDVQPSEAAFTLRATWRSVVVFDLDTGQAHTVSPDAAGRVSLGVTSHDFLIGLKND